MPFYFRNRLCFYCGINIIKFMYVSLWYSLHSSLFDPTLVNKYLTLYSKDNASPPFLIYWQDFIVSQLLYRVSISGIKIKIKIIPWIKYGGILKLILMDSGEWCDFSSIVLRFRTQCSKANYLSVFTWELWWINWFALFMVQDKYRCLLPTGPYNTSRLQFQFTSNLTYYFQRNNCPFS